MKKIICMLTIIILMTGCEKEEKLNCVMTDKQDDFTLNQTVSGTFSGDKLISATFELKYEVKNNQLINQIKQNSKETYNKYSKENGIQIKENTKKNIYTYQINFDTNKTSDNILDTFGLIGDNKLAIIDRLTKDGYTCKEG